MLTEEEYINRYSSPQPDALAELYRRTYLTRLYPHMCCEPLQGRLLAMLTRMIRPQRILELGTFSGYSTLCFAEGMPDGAEIHTVEIDDEAEDSLREVFDASPRAKSIKLHIGDALKIVPELPAPWDLVYIDANKRSYADYYALVKPLVAAGGYILADNTIWNDAVLDTQTMHDPQTLGIHHFNETVAADPDVEQLILPLYDGLTIIRKK